MSPKDSMQKYEKALESQSWHNVEPLMHGDVCVTFSSGTFKGKQEVQKHLKKPLHLSRIEKGYVSVSCW